MILVPLRTTRGQNVREHYAVRAKRVKAEHEAVAWMLNTVARPPIPCSVRLTRCAPSVGLDDDNLSGALKAVRDAVATWLGVDDKHKHLVSYVYDQRRAPWGVCIEFGEPVAPVRFVPLEATA